MSSERANVFSAGLLTTVTGTGAAAGRRRPRQAAAPAGLVGAWSTTPASSAPARPTGQASRAPGAAPAATRRCRACVAQPIQPHDLAELGLLDAAGGGTRQVAQQVPGAQPGQPGRVGGGHHQPMGPLRAPAAKLRVGGPPGLGVAVAEAALDAPPLARPPGAAPAQLAGGLHRGVGGLGRRPGALARLERQHERHAGTAERLDKPGVVAVEAVGHHRPKRDLGLLGRLD